MSFVFLQPVSFHAQDFMFKEEIAGNALTSCKITDIFNNNITDMFSEIASRKCYIHDGLF